ncbi:MAG TPA: hypothetical protein VN783_02420 [Thermoanaerobaculia bacterium]|nr:hypothetical protein [Thermoanaerobaculia bacterium]
MKSTRAALGVAVAASLAASWALWRFLPLSANDPLRGTIVLLPVLMAGFVLLERGAIRLGARRIPPAAALAEGIALVLLALLAIGRGHLGISGAEPVLAAGFALILAHRLARQTLALRPLLGTAEPKGAALSAIPEVPAWPFFALPLLAYLAILPWTSEQRPPDGDEPYYLLITHSLAYDFDANLTDDYQQEEWRHFMRRPIAPQPGDPVGSHGELYSRHNEMLPLLLAPSYRIAGLPGALATMAAMAAALAWMTLRLARRYPQIGPSGALLAYALAAFSPPLLLYSAQVWVEVPAALLAAIAIDRIRAPFAGTWDWRRWLAIGLPILVLPLLKIRFILLAGPLLVLTWWYGGRPKKPLLVLATLLGLVAAGIVLHNQILYGNPLKIHTWHEVEPTSYGFVDYAKGFLGIFWDAGFGLLGAAPIWLLALLALGALLLRRHPLPFDLAVFAFPYLAVVAPRSEWYGGWSPPFRYALIMLPFLALAVAPYADRRRRLGVRALIGGLGLLTLALALLWIAVPGWTYNFADGRTYLLDHLASRLGLDLARLFPSSIRPRLATWIFPAAMLLAGVLVLFVQAPGALRRRTGRRVTAGLAGLLGIAAGLGLLAALPSAAFRLPTRVVEFEDEQVVKKGGHLDPERWVVDRTRFRGTWVLREGERMEAPVSPGGHRLRLVLHGYFIRHHPGDLAVQVQAGGLPLATLRFHSERIWEARTVGPVDWPAGAPLSISLPPPASQLPPGGMANGMLFDRAELVWE